MRHGLGNHAALTWAQLRHEAKVAQAAHAREKKRLQSAARLAAGLCTNCGEPRGEGREHLKTCLRCIGTWREGRHQARPVAVLEPLPDPVVYETVWRDGIEWMLMFDGARRPVGDA